MSTAIMTDTEVRDWIEYACDSCGRPDLSDKIDIIWSGRMTRAIGKAGRRGGYRNFHIKLSNKLFARASHADQYETVIHEACHVLDHYINGRISAHGPGWESLMRRCGVEPKVYHSVDNSGLTRKFVYECPNGCADFKLSTRKHNDVGRGRYRLCRKCRSRITWTGKIEEPRL